MRTIGRKWFAGLIAAAIGTLLLVGALQWQSTHGAGYQFLEKAVRGSLAVRRQVGEVRSIRTAWLGEYQQKFVVTQAGSQGELTTTIVVEGTQRTATIKASLKQHDGTWSVSSATLDGHPISLD
jgi:hypothetical protein